MPCNFPIEAHRLADGSVVVGAERKAKGKSVATLWLSCGQCQGCRLERSRQWATRMMHEASLYDANCFLTLTYDDVHLPPGGSLVYRDFQLFMKRLRKRFPAERPRFYMCGEYGDDFHRPHFHACIFGFDFPDKAVFRSNRGGHSSLYRSSILESLWPFGFASIGALTFESAAYVARYCMKKVTGKAADQHYGVVDPATGEVFQRAPEFAHMSLKPGIGRQWLEKFHADVYPRGCVVVRGEEAMAPKYYDRWLKSVDPDRWAEVEERRVRASHAVDGSERSDERLAVRETVVRARAAAFKRDL